jgi:uroporphyrinogen-III synthase
MAVDTQEFQRNSDLDWVNAIGGHMAAGDTLDEALATAVTFATNLVHCDFCSIYVRQGDELILWVWKHTDEYGKEPSRLSLAESYVKFLAQSRGPVAHTAGNGVRAFQHWSTDLGESFVSVPLLAREELQGVMNLKHSAPRVYSQREVKLLSSAGFLLGAEIGIAQRESANADLHLELETHKLVERGKGILQRDLGLSGEEAYMRLQHHSRQKRKSISEIAQALILGDEFKRGAVSRPQ